MNPQNLFEQFLGPGAGQTASAAVQNAKGRMANSGMGGIAGGLAAGGLLGLLVGNKKARKSVGKIAGGVVGYGGAAALGAFAFNAYQKWQTNSQNPGGTTPPTVGAPSAELQPPPQNSKFLPSAAPDSSGRPFELALVLAMIVAANADGHIDSDEQKFVFDKVGELPLTAEDKAFVFDALSNPPSLQDIATSAQNEEQAVELYLASRFAIDPDHPMEKAYLEALASRLSLPADLVDHLEQQVLVATTR